MTIRSFFRILAIELGVVAGIYFSHWFAFV